MRSKPFFSALIILILLILLSYCDEAPTENIYNTFYSSDSLSNPGISPKVIFTNPANGTTGPFSGIDPTQNYQNPQITVQLNKLINIDRMLSNSIMLKTEESEHYLDLVGGYSDIFSNILIFNTERYLASKTYTLIIDTTLEDIHGKKLNEPHIVSFIPEPEFRLVTVYPLSDIVEPLYSPQIHLSFNSMVDSTIFNSFSISPNIIGQWSVGNNYYESDSLISIFTPSDTLLYNTEYSVSISNDAKDFNGLSVNKSYKFTFRTVPFRVRLSGYSSGVGSGGFYIFNNFGFDFNAIVDTSTVRSSISVTPQISYDFSLPYGGNNGGTRINFKEEEFLKNTKYTIQFASTMKSIYGDALEEYSYSFTTGL
jgi:Bacterial Ig-like domain